MFVTDFTYDGVTLSDLGYTICDFDYSDGIVTSSIGSTITFNKTARRYGKRYSLTGTQFDECITATFDICKDPCDQEMDYISELEMFTLTKWLNRREFLKLEFSSDYYENTSDREALAIVGEAIVGEAIVGEAELNENDTGQLSKRYCYASFNIEKLTVGDYIYGLQLTMETNSPFTYLDDRSTTLTFTSSTTSQSFDVYYLNDVGYLYPNVTITCNGSGTLQIANDAYSAQVVIYNCSEGEVITFSGDTHIITTTSNSHDIANDFNYSYLKLNSEFDIGNPYYTTNTITCTLPCSMLITYTPEIKNAMV